MSLSYESRSKDIRSGVQKGKSIHLSCLCSGNTHKKEHTYTHLFSHTGTQIHTPFSVSTALAFPSASDVDYWMVQDDSERPKHTSVGTDHPYSNLKVKAKQYCICILYIIYFYIHIIKSGGDKASLKTALFVSV